MEQAKSKREFTAYLLLSLAHSDAEFAPAEAQYIKQHLGSEEYNEVHKLFKSHSDAQAIDFIKEGAGRFIQSDSNQKELRNSMQELIEADDRINQMEKVVLNFLNRLMG